MPLFLLTAVLLSLAPHAWYATTTPLGLTLVALLAWMGFDACRAVWRWWRAVRRFGRG